MAFSFCHRALCAFAILICISGSAVAGNRMERPPKELEGVDLTEKLGATIPLYAEFVDETDTKVRIADLLGQRPVILTFNYSNCPMLCSVQLGGLVDALIKMKMSVGEEFDIITIGLDPNEDVARSVNTKEGYLERYERPSAPKGWHFLRGNASSIKLLADSVGFGFRYYPQRNEYLHPAVLSFISPQGKVSGYTYGVKYDENELTAKLIAAQTEALTKSVTQFILSCYHLEPRTGNGAVVAKIMQYGGLLFLIGGAFAAAVFGIKRSQMNAQAHQIGSKEDHV